MSGSSPASSVASVSPGASAPSPLLGGYLLVGLAAAWLAGIALRSVGPAREVTPLGWLLLALLGLGGVALALVGRRGGAASSSGASRWWSALLLGMLLCALGLGAMRAALADTSGAADAIGRIAHGEAVSLQGVVAAEPDVRSGYQILTVDVSSVSVGGGAQQAAQGRVTATIYGPLDWYSPSYGDTVELDGKLDAPSATAPPEVSAVVRSVKVGVVARAGDTSPLTWLANLRVRLAQALERTLPEPEASLLIGILLGLKTPALRARLALFTATGTIHLVVPAGLKVALLAEMSTRAFLPLRRWLGRWPATVAGLLVVGGYAALGGGGAAAVRAALMGALLVLAPALGRTYNVFTALALATLVMTAVDPLLVFDAGFQLTVLATFGLPLLTPPLERVLVPRLRRLPFGMLAAEALATTIAAQLSTLPVLALTFNTLSLVSPLANLLTVPLLAPLLLLGSALACGALLPGAVGGALTLVLGWILWPLLWEVNSAIAFCAGLPAAALSVPTLPGLVALGYYVPLALLVWRGRALWRGVARRLGRLGGTRIVAVLKSPGPMDKPQARASLGVRALGALCIVAGLASCGAAAPVLAAGNTATVAFLDVGPGGAATLVRLPSGAAVLVDGGPDGPTLASALGAQLPFWQRGLSLALLTDPRPGDARGLEDAATRYTLGLGADAGMAHPSADYLAWAHALSNAGATHGLVRAGNTLALDATSTLMVLSPPTRLYPPGNGSTQESNDLIVRLDTPGLRVLFLGSADAYALDGLAGSGQDLSADVVEVSVAPGASLDLAGPLGDVLRAARPGAIVVDDAPISATSKTARDAAQNDWRWADQQVSDQLGATVYRTSALGTITLSGGAGGWELG